MSPSLFNADTLYFQFQFKNSKIFIRLSINMKSRIMDNLKVLIKNPVDVSSFSPAELRSKISDTLNLEFQLKKSKIFIRFFINMKSRILRNLRVVITNPADFLSFSHAERRSKISDTLDLEFHLKKCKIFIWFFNHMKSRVLHNLKMVIANLADVLSFSLAERRPKISNTVDLEFQLKKSKIFIRFFINMKSRVLRNLRVVITNPADVLSFSLAERRSNITNTDDFEYQLKKF